MRFVQNYITDDFLVNSKQQSKFALGCIPFSIYLSDRIGICICQFCGSIFFTFWIYVSFFTHHVRDIFVRRSCRQMLRVDARRVVAKVHDKKPNWNRPVFHFPRNLVRTAHGTVCFKLTVAFEIPNCFPFPTFSKLRLMRRNRPVFVHLRPKISDVSIRKKVVSCTKVVKLIGSVCNRVHSMILSLGSRVCDNIREPFLFSTTSHSIAM